MGILPDYTQLLFVSIGGFGSGLGFLMSLGQLVIQRKKPINYLLSGLFLLLGLILLYLQAIRTGWLYSHPQFLYTLFPLVLLLAPILRWIVLSVFQERIIYRSKETYYLFPAFLSFLAPILSLLQPLELLRENLESIILEPSFRFWDILLFLSISYIGLIIYQIFHKIQNFFQWETITREYIAGILFFLTAATMVMVFASFVFLVYRPWWMIECLSLGLTTSLIISYLIGHKYPQFFRKVEEVIVEEKVKHSRSQLEGVDLEVLRQNLLDLMEKDKLYKDENLSLSDLADELAMSLHQISEFLNRHLGKNFSQFINEYRVEEAKKLLLENKERSVLDIALESGFGTKSSFHRAFTKYTGMSPTAWREKNLKPE